MRPLPVVTLTIGLALLAGIAAAARAGRPWVDWVHPWEAAVAGGLIIGSLGAIQRGRRRP